MNSIDDSETWVLIRKMMSDCIENVAVNGGPLNFDGMRAEIDRMLASTRDAGMSDAQGAVMAIVAAIHTLHSTQPVHWASLELFAPGVTAFTAAALLMEVLE